ncbi:MAG: phasin family protein [Xanthobacteraceae bacterium]
MAENTVRNFAQKGTEHAQETIEKAKTATAETTKAMQDSYRTASRGVAEFNVQLIDLAQNNMNATFDLARRLTRVQSPSEFLNYR